MAIAQTSLNSTLDPILENVAAELARRNVPVGSTDGAKAQMEIRKEEEVRRVVQVYWTPFQANIPGASVGLHLNIDQPSKHWVEAYISPTSQSWVFCFHERAVDGQYQLAYYRQSADWREAVTNFFDLTSWYALVPCDLTWADVKCSVGEGVPWTQAHEVAAGTGGELDKAVQESLKKSTIVWLRWKDSEGAERTMPVWYVFQDGKIYLVSGERQQTVPNARALRRADVIIRWKGHGNARVAELPVNVRVIPHGPEWDPIAEKLAEKRLNTPGAPEDLAARWRDECDVLELSFR